MRVNVLAKDFKAAVAVAAKACGKGQINSTLPYLLLSAGAEGEDGVSVVGTDLTLRAESVLDIPVDEPGDILLSHTALETFLDAVADDATVTLAVARGYKATLTCGQTVMRVAGLDPELFPALPEHAPRADVWVDAPTFRAHVVSVSGAAAKTAQDPKLTGVCIAVRDGQFLTLTAADGQRMARRRFGVEAEDVEDGDLEVIVPASALETVVSSYGRSTQGVRLCLNEGGSRILIECGSSRWQIVALAGPYPSLDRALAQVATSTLSVTRESVLRACKLVAGVAVSVQGAHATYTVSRVTISQEPGGLRFVSGDLTGDSVAQTVIPADRSADFAPFTLETAYLRQAVELMPELMVLEPCGPRSVFVRPAGEDRDHLHLLMQIAMGRA